MKLIDTIFLADRELRWVYRCPRGNVYVDERPDGNGGIEVEVEACVGLTRRDYRDARAQHESDRERCDDCGAPLLDYCRRCAEWERG